MTIAVNHGYTIARDPKALAAWQARQRVKRPQSIGQYRATVARMAQRLPGVVRVN